MLEAERPATCSIPVVRKRWSAGHSFVGSVIQQARSELRLEQANSASAPRRRNVRGTISWRSQVLSGVIKDTYANFSLQIVLRALKNGLGCLRGWRGGDILAEEEMSQGEGSRAFWTRQQGWSRSGSQRGQVAGTE